MPCGMVHSRELHILILFQVGILQIPFVLRFPKQGAFGLRALAAFLFNIARAPCTQIETFTEEIVVCTDFLFSKTPLRLPVPVFFLW